MARRAVLLPCAEAEIHFASHVALEIVFACVCLFTNVVVTLGESAAVGHCSASTPSAYHNLYRL